MEHETSHQPVDASDEGWLEEASLELDRLWDGTRSAIDLKKRATVIELARAAMEGRTRESVFDRPDTCSRNTYTRWSQDPVFIEVMDNVMRIARHYRDQRGLRSLKKAAEMLSLATPYAVARIAKIIQSKDDRVALAASTAILDRAALETSLKSVAGVGAAEDMNAGVSKVNLDKLSDDDLRTWLALQEKLNKKDDDDSGDPE